VGRVAFKRRVIPLKGDHVFAPHYASRLSTFRAPGWGTPAILPPCRWRNATSWKLVPFSHRSASRIFIRQPGCAPSLVVTQDGDHQPLGGEKQAGLRPLPLPQLQGCSSSLLGRRARRAGALPPTRVGWPPPLPASGGRNHPPALRRRRPPAMPGKANCCCPARMQHSALFLAFAARTGVRTCRCALQTVGVGGEADAVVRAAVVAAGGSSPLVEAVSAAHGPAPALWL
jgi:hypothetical protein